MQVLIVTDYIDTFGYTPIQATVLPTTIFFAVGSACYSAQYVAERSSNMFNFSDVLCVCQYIESLSEKFFLCILCFLKNLIPH